MVPIQPPLIPLFFAKGSRSKTRRTNNTLHQAFFLSWEDALWQLLKNHQVPEESVVLIPSFFCWDVVENMQAHGLRHVVYEVDAQLQPDQADFEKKLLEHSPTIVVIFHAVGITNPLIQNTTWLKYLPKEAILIEDCVHRIIDDADIRFITKNHYLMDSLRKVAPIQGSRVFSQHHIPQPSLRDALSTFWYRNKILSWWIIMQLSLILAYVSKSSRVQKHGNMLAEYAMKAGYDIIGDHPNPSPAPRIMQFLAQKLNLEFIHKIKEQQVELYSDLLSATLESALLFKIPFADTDAKELRGFPVGIRLPQSDAFLAHLRSNGVLVRFELNDSPWAAKQKIVYLPMGPHMSTEDIERICGVVTGF